VHHHLIRKGLRTSVGLVVETGEAREVHHFATAWQAMAPKRSTPIWPSTRCSTCMPRRVPAGSRPYEAVKRYIKAIGKGILKVMSKMGISTYQSYCGAQIFDAVGLSRISSTYFTGTRPDRGRRPAEVAAKPSSRTPLAFSNDPVLPQRAGRGRRICSACAAKSHVWTPDVVADLQHAVRGNAPEKYREFARQVNDRTNAQLMTMRGLFRIKLAEEIGARRCRWTRSSRPRKSSSGFHRRHVVRLDQPRGAHRRWRWP
jgi:glutamate synthase (NADPH/NADH) large chain